MSAVLAADYSASTTEDFDWTHVVSSPSDVPSYCDPQVDAFATYVTNSRVVPFERSPISMESIVQIVKASGGAGIGATVGLLAGGGTPLMLVTVPAGIILCGAATGIASALEEGLRLRVLGLMGVKPRKRRQKQSAD
jgi:hypothetical protein